MERCARSLFGQTLDDIEYIFVDDCSPDRSIDIMLKVLNDYPQRKDAVKVIRHERNQGVSVTRQDGVDAATGDYIIHCDPDDWVDSDAYETIYHTAVDKGADFVMFDDYRDNEYVYNVVQPYDHISLLEDFSGVTGRYVFAGLCRNLIRADIAKKARIPAEVCNGEDVNVMFQILRHPIKIEYLQHKFYHYCSNPHSLTKQMSVAELERDYVNIRLLEAMKTGSNVRYDRCVDSFIFAIISTRAFVSGVYSSREFKEKYGKYSHTAKFYKRGTLVSRMLVKLSMLGFYRPALHCYNMLYKLKHGLRR